VQNAFKRVNFGTFSVKVPIPRAITLIVPKNTFPPFGTHRVTEIIDTRGISAEELLGLSKDGRKELEIFLEDDHTLCVLCSPFTDPPGPYVMAFLSRALTRDMDLLAIASRTLLLVLPHDNQENDADIDGQGNKIQSDTLLFLPG